VREKERTRARARARFGGNRERRSRDRRVDTTIKRVCLNSRSLRQHCYSSSCGMNTKFQRSGSRINRESSFRAFAMPRLVDHQLSRQSHISSLLALSFSLSLSLNHDRHDDHHDRARLQPLLCVFPRRSSTNRGLPAGNIFFSLLRAGPRPSTMVGGRRVKLAPSSRATTTMSMVAGRSDNNVVVTTLQPTTAQQVSSLSLSLSVSPARGAFSLSLRRRVSSTGRSRDVSRPRGRTRVAVYLAGRATPP